MTNAELLEWRAHLAADRITARYHPPPWIRTHVLWSPSTSTAVSSGLTGSTFPEHLLMRQALLITEWEKRPGTPCPGELAASGSEAVLFCPESAHTPGSPRPPTWWMPRAVHPPLPLSTAAVPTTTALRHHTCMSLPLHLVHANIPNPKEMEETARPVLQGYLSH